MRTVQEVLEDALAQLTGSAAGDECQRTDRRRRARAGTGRPFLDRLRHSTETFVRALNAILPHDVRVLAAEEMPQAFHATLDAKSKRYRYVIDNGAIANVFQLRYRWHVRRALDAAAMARAAAVSAGTARLPQLRDRMAQSHQQRAHDLRFDRRAGRVVS